MANNTTIKSNAMKGCTLAGQYHLAGSSWHPYLPPVGFDTCAVCSCDVSVTLFLLFHRSLLNKENTHFPYREATQCPSFPLPIVKVSKSDRSVQMISKGRLHYQRTQVCIIQPVKYHSISVHQRNRFARLRIPRLRGP